MDGGGKRIYSGSSRGAACPQHHPSKLLSSSVPHFYPTLPSQVATVDKYQGQQNDYVLLSLVRTRIVGHLRDVRRLVVAMSRARLGLYVFGRKELFANCYELQPTFKWVAMEGFRLQIRLMNLPPDY